MARHRQGAVVGRSRSVAASPEPAPPPRRPRSLLPLIFGAAAVVVVAAIIAGNAVRGRASSASSASTGGAGGAAVAAGALFPVDARVKGAADAPVTIVEYADLQCPNCATWELNVEPQIEKDYIATGKVRLEVRDFAFLGAESTRAAIAVECAGEQGRFWEYRTALYRSQRGENRGAFSDANLKTIANQAGVDGNALAACLASGRYADRVSADLQTGKLAGVDGTPTFFINGQKVVGALPYASFKAVIDQALAAATAAPNAGR